MKKLLVFLFFAGTLLAQETAESDSGRTSVPLSRVKFYQIVKDTDLPGETAGGDPASERPFAFRQPGDRWFSKDKWMHLTSSYFITMQAGYTFHRMFYFDAKSSQYMSVGVGFSAALGKEFYDVFEKKGIFSWKDLCYDILGSALGYLTLTALQ